METMACGVLLVMFLCVASIVFIAGYNAGSH